MGLLDGALQAVFGGAFGPLFLDGTLHAASTVPDGEGGFTTAFTDHAIKGMVDTYTDEYRARNGIPETDVKLIVLQFGVAGIPTLDGQITLRGARYSIQAIGQDPAQAAWTIRGRPV